MKTKSPCWNYLHPSLKLLTTAVAAVIACFQPYAQGTDIATLKLYGNWTGPTPATSVTPANFTMGRDNATATPNSLAANETWIVAGVPLAGTPSVNLSGAAQVFNAITGAWVRKLQLPATATLTSSYFGTSCAVKGSIAVIGAPGPTASSPGAAYVYNLATGALLKTLKPNVADGVNGDYFGMSVAISGNRVVVGAYSDDALKGSAYVFDLTTGVQLAKFLDPGGVAGDRFGFTCAAEGNVAVIGAPGADSSKGAAYAYDLTALAFIKKYQPGAAAASDQAGWALAMHQGKIILGAPYAGGSIGKIFVMGLLDGSSVTLTASDAVAGEYIGRCVSTHQGLLIAGSPYQAGGGAIYIYDLNSTATTEFQKVVPPDGGSRYFGHNVSICGNQAVILAPYDSTQASFAGAAYVMQPIMRPMPLTKVTAKADFAPGAVDSSFGTIGDAFINVNSEVTFASTTTGLGSNGSKDTGIWTTLNINQPLNLLLKSRMIDTVGSLVSVSAPLANNSSMSIFRGVLGGTGISALNNQAIYKGDGSTFTRILRTGDPAAAFGGAPLASFTQVVQTTNVNRVVTTCALRQGLVGITATSDSGLLWYDVGSGAAEAQREGLSPAGVVPAVTYGQFSGRVAAYWAKATYSTALAAPTTAAFNQAIFQKTYGGAIVKVVQKGNLDAGGSGAGYSSFLGESSDDTNERVLFRATLGAPATAANNEGLWMCVTPGTSASDVRVMRKGDLVPGLPGVKIAKFIQFSQVYNSALALVQLSGTGVTAANDQALLVLRHDGTLINDQLTVLLREGDPAPGCGGATIGTINRVALEPYFAQYMVLTTLVGAPTGTDLVLFRGFAKKSLVSVAEKTLIRPVPVLRKGQLFANQPGKITSISLPTTSFTASGAGNTGLGVAMAQTGSSNVPNTVVIAVDFSNGVHQVMQGIP